MSHVRRLVLRLPKKSRVRSGEMANMIGRLRCLRGVFVVVLLMPLTQAQTTLTANTQSTTIPQTVEDVLHQMSDIADVVFAGQVTAIRPHDAGTTSAGFIEIDFQVDQAIRGCTAGGTYVLREWAGLWAGNVHRYSVGQHLLMFLHAPGASGLSSPVGGLDGAIPIRGGGGASLFATASTVPSAPVADLRWLGTKLLHPVAYKLQSVLPATPLTMAQQMAGLSSPDELIADPIAGVTDSVNHASVPIQQASVDTVVKLLSSWQKAPHDDVR
jgi:hypothetical protein